MKLWKPVIAAILIGPGFSPLYADFTYEQTTRITGGAMVSMMKFAGAFSKDAHKAMDPIQATVSVKGDRMVHKTADSLSITDLDKETITHVNFANRTYSVITFAQMKQAMEEMSQKMQKGANTQGADMQFDVKVNDTGNTKPINGYTARETIMTITMQGTDAKSGAKGGIDMTTDMWIAPNVAGYGEVRDFYKRMAEKMAWIPGTNPMMMSRPGMSQAMARMYKEGTKLDGMPVVEIIRMGGNMQGVPQGDSSQTAMPPTSISGALGGMLAGRMAKRKKDEAPSDSGSAAGSLMEMTMEVTSFSASPADSALFDIPSGFTKVDEDPMHPARTKK
ncbi:MAG: hypothetical protein JWO80_739 [Bryobacterales bacterium]|nr:hypothetical protein [Bryobacterales bacterium]